MRIDFKRCSRMLRALPLAALAYPFSVMAETEPRVDLLGFANGAVPVSVDDEARKLGVGLSQALQVIDGDPGGFVLTRKPGDRGVAIVFVYELPSRTTFESFVVPNVLETPSPSQTFVKTVRIAGSDTGRDGPFEELAQVALETHQGKGQRTEFDAKPGQPVRWVQVTLAGGINIEREKTFFEFSEIAGYGVQDQVPLSQAFSGKWKGRGVKLALNQKGVRVSGCYDLDGELNGTVSGNILRATGETRKSAIKSTFVFLVGDNAEIIGVRSTNGAPFRLYTGKPAPSLRTACEKPSVAAIGCGSVVHGIRFDFDSADIRPQSNATLAALHEGLLSSTATSITVVGHTSSEGSDAYNDELSQRRAEAIAFALVARGIEAERVSALGQGERHPIADNGSEAGRALNRRVEIACR